MSMNEVEIPFFTLVVDTLMQAQWQALTFIEHPFSESKYASVKFGDLTLLVIFNERECQISKVMSASCDDIELMVDDLPSEYLPHLIFIEAVRLFKSNDVTQFMRKYFFQLRTNWFYKGLTETIASTWNIDLYNTKLTTMTKCVVEVYKDENSLTKQILAIDEFTVVTDPYNSLIKTLKGE